LICAHFGLFVADSIAALVVAMIVIYISYRLGKRSIEVLLDKVPSGTFGKVELVLQTIPEITRFHNLRIRASGPYTFVDVNIHVQPSLTIEEAHEISHKVEAEIRKIITRCEIHIHEEPEERVTK